MIQEHDVVYIPGLHDRSIFNRTVVRVLPFFWDRRGFPLHVVYPHWEEGTGFGSKLRMIRDKVDELTAEGHTTSVIGQSAGGSAALNAFCLRRDAVTAAINVTGRLREGVNVRPTLHKASSTSLAFRNSVYLFENYSEPTLSAEDRKKIMTVRPKWDETVPPFATALPGASNRVFPVYEHTMGGILIMTVYASELQDFLRSRENR